MMMTDFNEPIVVSGVSAAILIYEMEFKEYAQINGIKNYIRNNRA